HENIENRITAPTNTTMEPKALNLSKPRVLNVAIVGFGTVGSSVARILSENCPAGLRLTHIYNRNIERKRVDWLPGTIRWTEEIADVLLVGRRIVMVMLRM